MKLSKDQFKYMKKLKKDDATEQRLELVPQVHYARSWRSAWSEAVV